MDIDYSPEDLAFRQEVKDWFEANLTPDLKAAAESGADLGGAVSIDQMVAWAKKLSEKGWLAPS